ncbi:MAG: glycine--tRNA ligase subunit beta [Candidatus Acididesulfobacter guangdongensis]|uniref:Glycine--tRNA ligase beta subunit n=1 Tax=Acididesulfobacter guangdongensis TaxID=2597225 RepID=A0A519BG76_ACIG2|nr:MAG: glycine--tRNA ligase subunit beta [Candidatus Acididesulfobacter guangdongensis]
MSEFLLEIGSGELPYQEVSAFPPRLSESFKTFFAKELDFKDDENKNVECYSTSRRVALLIKNIPLKTEDKEAEIIGPPLKVCYMPDGSPAAPLMQFIKKNNIKNDKKIYAVSQKKGEYAAYKTIIKGRNTEKILSDNIPSIINKLPFKKSMRWSNADVRYPRPILWILALFDGKVVRFNYGDCKAGNYSYISRKDSFLKSFVKIENINDYIEKLKKAGIILNNLERKNFIEKELIDNAKKIECVFEDDSNLIDEITGITENPHAVRGQFDKKFLHIPHELLSLAMKKHQRFFPLFAKENSKLMPYFIGVANITSNLQHDEPRDNNISRGYSRVLAARLNDADFFYKEDVKKNIEYFIDKTKDVVFYKGLGTYYEKTERLKQLAPYIFENIFGNKKAVSSAVSSIDTTETLTANIKNKKIIERCASLLKFDLTTHVVYEFPELQGVIGRIYANKFGESEIVARAIEEHYYPTMKHGKKLMPADKFGDISAISDKFDTVLSFAMLNKLPTGESDPFAIRRAMIGMIEILLEKQYSISLNKIFDFYFNNFYKGKSLDLINLKDIFILFAKTRFKNIMLSLNYNFDEISSVADDIFFDDIYTSYLKIDFVSKNKLHEYMYDLTFVFKRLNNITFNSGSTVFFDSEKLILKEEVSLIKSYEFIKNESHRYIKLNNYYKLMNLYHEIVRPVNKFFDNVMVNVDELDLRNSRIGLLNSILLELKNLCDFSKLSY